MTGVYVEHRITHGHQAMPWDIARHLYTRALIGSAAVIAERPTGLLKDTRTQWYRVIRRAQKLREKSDDITKIVELTRYISRYQSFRFTARPLLDDPAADVHFGTLGEFKKFPPVCKTLYVAVPVFDALLFELMEFMPQYSLVVLYNQGKAN